MREVTAETFARMLKHRLDQKHRYAFFLGAGCSRSSGIMAAGDLVRHWVAEYHRLDGAPDTALTWAQKHFEKYDEGNAAAYYGKAMDLFFPTPALRQIEIDRQVGDKNPGYGYATLAALLAHQPQCNVVLTTNFDDLVADALYLFTRRRPLVITHSSLSGFARLTSEKPLVVKLHGDAHLSPQNTQDETNRLHNELEELFGRLIQERGLIFMGYGANDESITNALRKLPANHVQAGIFWVNNTWPTGEFGEWLKSQKAVWVKHLDFDEVMFLVGEELALPKVEQQRFDDIFQSYEKKFTNLFESIGKKAQQPSATKTDKALADIAKKSTEGDTSPAALIRQAYLLPQGPTRTAALRDAVEKNADSAMLLGALALELVELREQPDEAEKLYRRAIEADPNNAINLGNFANFLTDTRKQHDEAEQFYRRAVETDANDAIQLGNFANFLTDIRKQHDEAELLYRRAVKADPNDAFNLGNFALFLTNIRKQHHEAELFYRRAVEADPNNAANLGNFATFLTNIRKQHDDAELFFKRTVDADPNNATNLGNFALFLTNIRKQYDEAEPYYRRAIEADPNNATHLGNFAIFLEHVREQHDEAEMFYRRAVEADPNYAPHLGNFANFLTNVRKQHDEAEMFYRRAVEADPNYAVHLGNFASFLTDIRKQHDEAEMFFRRAVEADPNHANNLGNFANFLTNIRKQHDEAEQFYRRALEADTNNPNIMGNLARMLFAKGRSDEAIALLDQAMALVGAETNTALLLELFFYRLAHDHRIEPAVALREVRARLLAGHRSPGWDLTDNVAREDGHPFADLLAAIAKVIAEEEPLSSLDAFPEWRESGAGEDTAAG